MLIYQGYVHVYFLNETPDLQIPPEQLQDPGSPPCRLELGHFDQAHRLKNGRQRNTKAETTYVETINVAMETQLYPQLKDTRPWWYFHIFVDVDE